MQRLVLIDGHAIIHRAYHALPPLTSSSGQLVNAVYGFVSMLLRVIEELKPTHMAVCFDLPGPTFRHEAYIAYQAKRPVMDKELSGQIELVHEVVEAAGIPIYTAAGFEADDVIGTLAGQSKSKFKSKIDEVVIVTGDRDILQLVSGPTSPRLRGASKVKVYMTIRGLAEAKMFDEKEVEEYIGIKPEQIIDYKALIGDSSDNYPGVPGIGPKTAVGLLKKYASLDILYRKMEGARLDSTSSARRGGWKLEGITPAVVQKLKEGKEAAMLSQNLAQIRTDAPVELDLERAHLRDLRENEGFIEKLRELRFKSLVARLDSARLGRLNSGNPPSRKATEGRGGQMGLL